MVVMSNGGADPAGGVSDETTGPLSAGVVPVAGSEVLDPVELESRRAGLEEIMELMRPSVQMDGGDLALVDVDYEAGVVEVQLQGACGSCAISSMTLQGGVERLIKDRLPWVTEVRGGIDESMDELESAALGRGAYVPRYD
jgi:Fe-S cluster biogenesis protein NfuA